MIIFQSARLKLTAWYVLLSMIISVLFSLTIFLFLSHSLELSYQRLEYRSQIFPPGPEIVERLSLQRQEMEIIESQIKLRLGLVNLTILFISALSGYFLAGRTLKPIKTMVETQNRFIADASHEVRTPLTAMKTEIEVTLRDRKLTLKKAKEILKNNLKDVDGLKKLSDGLLVLAAFAENGTKHQFLQIKLTEILKESIKRVNSLAKEKNLKISLTSDNSAVSGSRELLIELFVIFLDNAIKYSQSNSKIEVSSLQKGDQVSVSFKDSGIGIKSDDLPFIFDRFYRADKSRTRTQVGGHGLGLSIAKQIIQYHHGRVSVVSTPGKETIFTVTLTPLR